METLSDIAVFVQVVDSGSFTAAADRLNISKSVVSKYVTRLEDQLGVRLLNRTTRRLSLTEAGNILYSRSRRGLEEIEAAEAEISQFQKTPRGTLKINAPMSFGILHIAPHLSEFSARYPDLVTDINFDDKQIDLIDEGFDLAIRIAELPDSTLVARRLGPCRHVVCAAPDYLTKHGIPSTPENLSSHNVLTFRYQDSPSEWHFISEEGKFVSVPVNGTIQMNNSLALREALIKGAGVTLTPTFIVGEDIKAGRLKKLLPDYRPHELSIYAVYPERRHLSPKVQAFIEFMKEKVSDPPYWD